MRIQRRARTVDWSLPYGFGAPGLLVEGPVSAGDLDPLAARMRDRRAAEVRIRTTPADSAAWRAVPAAQQVAHRTHVINLAGGWGSVWAEFKSEARTATRKARKAGTSVHCADDSVAGTETYLKVWREWVRGRASKSRIPTPLLELAAARRDPPRHFRLAAQRLDGLYEVWVAEHRGRPIAATLVLVHGQEAAMWRTASAPDAAPIRANDLLMATIVESLCERGTQRYVLGESNGKKSLEAFKEKFAGRAHAVPEIVIRP